MLDDLPRCVGRYEVVGELGSGGMASVYLGRAAGIGGFERLLAIKTIHPHLAKRSSFVRMFLDEARIAARIRHPNVVQVYEVGEEGGRLFIVMDYVGGESLSHTMGRLRDQKMFLDFGIAAFLMFSAAEALNAAHECRDGSGNLLGVIHRDVSPKNILVGYDGVLRILDFGVAKALDQLDQTATGTHKGTAAYMAPEQIEDGGIDRRTDIFALGVVLWEITTGRRLFKGSNDMATSENIRRCQVPRPSSFRAEYPGQLERIVLKALRRSPADRHQTGRELAEDLREYLGTRPRLCSSIDVEQFIRTLFADRYKEKLEVERNALSASPTPFKRAPWELSQSQSDSVSLPRADDPGTSDEAEPTTPVRRVAAAPREISAEVSLTRQRPTTVEVDETVSRPSAPMLDEEQSPSMIAELQAPPRVPVTYIVAAIVTVLAAVGATIALRSQSPSDEVVSIAAGNVPSEVATASVTSAREGTPVEPREPAVEPEREGPPAQATAVPDPHPMEQKPSDPPHAPSKVLKKHQKKPTGNGPTLVGSDDL